MNDVLSMIIIGIALIAVILVALYSVYAPYKGVAVAALMRRPVDISLWLNHHRRMGVKHFYIRLEDSPGWVDIMKMQNDVTLVVASSDTEGNNYETLQYRQNDFVTWAMQQAMGKYSWLFHIDADELLHGDLEVLQTLPQHVKCVHLENVEAVFDKDNNDTCFSAKKFLKCSHGAPCTSYANGKGAGRVEDGVAPHGPHMFTYKDGSDKMAFFDIPFDVLHVLHFDSCSLGSWIEKYYHLSKNKQDNIPFQYYNESINASKQAFDTYNKYKMQLSNIDEDQVYTRDTFVDGPFPNDEDPSYGGMHCASVGSTL